LLDTDMNRRTIAGPLQMLEHVHTGETHSVLASSMSPDGTQQADSIFFPFLKEEERAFDEKKEGLSRKPGTRDKLNRRKGR